MDKTLKRQGSILNFSHFPRFPPIHKEKRKKKINFFLLFPSSSLSEESPKFWLTATLLFTTFFKK